MSGYSHANRVIELDALRLPCPTCGGTQKVTAADPPAPGLIPLTIPCPDCTDGRMSHERAWKIVAAVFEKGEAGPDFNDGYRYGWQDAFQLLRGVR